MNETEMPYPPSLKAGIVHAERLAQVFLEEEARVHGSPHVTNWLVGRASELEQFVASIAEDWKTERASAEVAAAALDKYLADLHAGLAMRLGITHPVCCVPDWPAKLTPSQLEERSLLLQSIDRLLMNLDSHATGRPSSE